MPKTIRTPPPPADPPDAVLVVPVTGRDQLALAEMMRACGESDNVAIVRLALWRFGEHLGLDFPLDVFEARRATLRKRARS